MSGEQGLDAYPHLFAYREMKTTKTALITGAAQGIGRAVALELAEQRWDIVINDLQPATSEAAREVLASVRARDRQALYVQADVSDREAVQQMFASAVERFGSIDTVVSNAAWMQREKVVDAEWEGFRRTLEVNQFGLFHVCQAAARQMVAQVEAGRRSNSSIVVIGSVHAKVVFENNAAYAMSKAAANQFARVLAKELVPYQIRVNTINPGWTDTPGERRFLNEAALQKAAAALPLGRLAKAEEIAQSVAFLASDAASYITGSELGVDGGVVIAPESVCEQR